VDNHNHRFKYSAYATLQSRLSGRAAFEAKRMSWPELCSSTNPVSNSWQLHRRNEPQCMNPPTFPCSPAAFPSDCLIRHRQGLAEEGKLAVCLAGCFMSLVRVLYYPIKLGNTFSKLMNYKHTHRPAASAHGRGKSRQKSGMWQNRNWDLPTFRCPPPDQKSATLAKPSM